MSAPGQAGAPQTVLPQAVQDDAIKFLRLLLRQCNGSPDAHSWRKCRRCAALAQLQDRDPLAVRLVESAIGALEGCAQAPTPTHDTEWPCGCARDYCPTHRPSYLPAPPSTQQEK